MKKRMFAGLLSALLLVGALCGCQEEEPQEVGGIGSQEAGEEKKPISGGELVIGTLQDLDESLEPYGGAAETREVLFNVYEGLVKADAKGDYVPAVAAESTVSEDGRTYTFPLREGVSFHNGDPVTAQDVIASFAACEADTEDPALAQALSNVLRVEDQEGTVTVTLRQPDPDFLSYVSLVYITPAEGNQPLGEEEDQEGETGQGSRTDRTGQTDRNNQNGQTNRTNGSRQSSATGREELDSTPVGTGPFQVAEDQEDQGDLVLERFDGYWGEKAYLDKVIFREYTSSSRLTADLEEGVLDMALHLSQEELESVSASSYKILEGSRNQVQTLYLNHAQEPFDNDMVCQAIGYAVDVDGILSLAGESAGTKAGGPIYPALAKYYEAELAEKSAQDVEKARDLLAEAGYEEGFSMTILAPSDDPIHETVAELLAGQLAEVDIRATVRTVSRETWMSRVYEERDFQSTLVSFDAAVCSAEAVLEPWTSDSPENFSGYEDPLYDRLLDQAAAAAEEGERISLYQQGARRLVENGAGVFVQDLPDFVAVRTYVDGYQFYPLQALNLAGLYYAQDTSTPAEET